jgi:phospholipase C
VRARLTRRELLGAGALGAAGLYGAGSARPLLDAVAAPRRSGQLSNIDHIVILIQENRSFDHYFGALSGVRGWDDGHRQPLAGGGSVIAQPGYPVPGYGGRLYPFHLHTGSGHGECTIDPDHSWSVQHRSWNGGGMDSFVREHLAADKSPITMGYYRREELPFYYQLADAFTICDNYFCSVLGPSDGNHAYLISGMLDHEGKHGGPLISSANPASLSWTTMPEQLQARGISWKVYTSPDNYLPEAVGDPIFYLFSQYYQRPELAQRAFLPQYPVDFVNDARNGTLPAVSWIYTPIAQSEHPPAPVSLGQLATAQIVEALTSNADAWSRTALFVTWDENGGFFDHVAPPTPPAGTPGEFLSSPLPAEAAGIAGPIGFGFRVPLLIVSPFARGGYVCSDTFDHTSILRFIEARFGAEVPYLSAWRRETAGDLTSAFDFGAPDGSVPPLPTVSVADAATGDCAVTIVNAETKLLPAADYPVPPNTLPYQEPGGARRLPGLPGVGLSTGGSAGHRGRRKRHRPRHAHRVHRRRATRRRRRHA